MDVDLFNPSNVSQERIIALIDKMQVANDLPIILLPGRLTEWKGQLYFMDVLSMVKNKNYLCLIVGDAKDHEDYLNKLKDKIKDDGKLIGVAYLGWLEGDMETACKDLESLVKIEDNISDMSAGYMLADIVVSTSIRGEAFGRVVPEAQAMKKRTYSKVKRILFMR